VKKRAKLHSDRAKVAEPRLDREAEEGTPRRLLALGAGLLIVALAIVGTTESDVGGWLGLAALIVLIYGVHRFGRLGPDEPAPKSSSQ